VKRLPLVLALALTACATSSAFRNGERAERRQDFDKAVLEYSKALQEHPDKLDYRKALRRAKLRDSEEHTVAGRRLLGRGLFKEALDEFKLAYDLNPTSSTLPREIESAEAQRRANAPAPTIDQIKDRAPASRRPTRRWARPLASTSSSIPSSTTSPSPSTSPTWASSRR